MHESAIATSILDLVLHALPDQQQRITKITIVAGVLAGVEPSCLELYFSELAKDTAAEHAELILKCKDAQLLCQTCGNRETFQGRGSVKIECEKCGGLNRLQDGSEMYLESIEVAERFL